MGAVWAGIAGILTATVGTHEVIATIMLNWIAIWIGQFLFGLGGPLQNDTQPFVPVSNDVVEGARLPTFWGDPFLQALHAGFFVALAALVVYWITLRPDARLRVRAVYNPRLPATAASRSRATSSSRWRSPALRRARRRDRHRRLSFGSTPTA
jgi:simple sugar transport system permease protein